jgi:hypothetical protein
LSDKIIICDTGPLIALATITQIELLSSFFQKVILPTSVVEECLVRPDLPGAKQINTLIESHFFEIYSTPVLKDPLLAFLGSGESAAIQLAINLKSVLLIDEKMGRSVAKKLNVSVLGTAGLLLAGHQKGLIKDLKLTLNLLKKTGYRLSGSLIEEVLRRAVH